MVLSYYNFIVPSMKFGAGLLIVKLPLLEWHFTKPGPFLFYGLVWIAGPLGPCGQPTRWADQEIVIVNIYVGNLSFDTTEDDLRDAFATYGEVSSVAIIKDKFSGQSRGFGFVEMAGNPEANAAMQALNGSDLNGRALTVNEARPREERSGGGGGNRFDRGGGGNRSNNRSGGGRRNW
jgi:hypothetical protein